MKKNQQVDLQKAAGYSLGVSLAYDTTKLLRYWSSRDNKPKNQPTFYDILSDVKFFVRNKFGEADCTTNNVIGKEFILACIDPDAIQEGYDLYMKEEGKV